MHSCLSELFRLPGIAVREASLCEDHEPLHPAEAVAVAASVEKRQREFRAGRSCARKALAELGITDFPLLVGADRAPVWPKSVVGSITHTDGCPGGYCAVAVAHHDTAMGLGLDAEPRLALPAELWPLVLDEEEQRDAHRAPEPGVAARLVFSAKETTYKALYPILRRFLEFSDVHVELLAERGVFFAELVGSARSLRLAEGRLMGRIVINDEILVTGMSLSAAGLTLA
jgi:4'-phosphopantetheinyl transferase EntD